MKSSQAPGREIQTHSSRVGVSAINGYGPSQAFVFFCTQKPFLRSLDHLPDALPVVGLVQPTLQQIVEHHAQRRSIPHESKLWYCLEGNHCLQGKLERVAARMDAIMASCHDDHDDHHHGSLPMIAFKAVVISRQPYRIPFALQHVPKDSILVG